jgi:hypothetical protein
LTGFLQFVILAGTAATIVGAGVFKLLRAFDKRTTAISAAQTAVLQRAIEQRLQPIQAELETPSGRTLKDTVIGIGEQVSDLREAGDRRHSENQELLEVQQETLEDQQHEMDTMGRAIAVLLRAWRRSNPELPVSDELLVDLDRSSARRGHYRRSRSRRKDDDE